MIDPAEIPANSHWTMYSTQGEGASATMTPLQTFEVHWAIDLTSPCFIDVGDHAMYPGIHVTKYAARIEQDTGISDISNPPPSATEEQKTLVATALQREQDVALVGNFVPGHPGIKAITSASASVYPPSDTDTSCTTVHPGLIPNAACFDDASNKQRAQMCQAAWAADRNLYEGSDLVLTAPLNGDSFGLVDGENPVNTGPVQGAKFYVNDSLHEFTGFRIFEQLDGSSGVGNIVFASTAPQMVTQGVWHSVLVSATNPTDTTMIGFVSVFANLGSDNVGF